MPQCSEGRGNTNCNNHAQRLTECYNIKRGAGKEVNNINIYSCTAPRRQTSLREPPLSALSHGRPSTSSTMSLPLEMPTSATTITKWNWISKNERNSSNSKNNDSKTSSGSKDVNSKPFRVELCNDNEKKQHWLQSALAEELLHNERHAQKWEINKSASTHICANNERTAKSFFLPRAVKPTQNVHNTIYDRQEERWLQRESERSANEHLRVEATAELKPVHNLIGLATYLLKQTSQHRNCPASPTVFTDHDLHWHKKECHEENIHQVNKEERELQEEKLDFAQKAQELNYVSSPVQENNDVQKDLFIYGSKNNNNNNNSNNESSRESKYTNTLQDIRDVYLTNTSRESAKRRYSKSAANKLSSTKKNNDNDDGSGDANKNCHGMNAVGVLQYSDAYKHIYCTSNEKTWKSKEKNQRNSPDINTSNDSNKHNKNNNESNSSDGSGSRRRVRRRGYNSSGSNNSNHTSVIADIANGYYNACQVSEGRSTPCTELSCVKSSQVSEPSMWEYCMQMNSNSSAKVNTDGQDRSLHGVQLLQHTASTEKTKYTKPNALHDEHTEFSQQQIRSHQLNNEEEHEEEKGNECWQHDELECRESVAQELYFDTSPLMRSLQTQQTPAHDGTEINKIALKPSPPSSKPTCGAFRTYKQVEDMCMEQVKPCNKSLSSCQCTQTSNVNENVNESAKFSSHVSNKEPSTKPHLKKQEVNADSGDIPCNRSIGEEVAITIDDTDATVLSKTSVSVQVESSVIDTARDDNVILNESEEANASKPFDSLKMIEKENTDASHSFYQGLQLALLQWQTEERELIEQEYSTTINNWREFYELAKCEIKARCDIVNAESEFTKEIVYNQWCAMILMQFCFILDTSRINLEIKELHESEYLTASEQAELLYLHHKADTSILYLEQWKKLESWEISQMKAIVKLEEEERNKLEILDVKYRLHQCEHVLYEQIECIATLRLENEHKENLLYMMLANDELLQRETIASHEMDEYYLLLLNQYTLFELEERVQFWQEQMVAFTFILSELVSIASGQFNDRCRFLARSTDDANVTVLVNTENSKNSTHSSNNEQLAVLAYHDELIDTGSKGNDVVDDTLESNTYERQEGKVTHSNVYNYLMHNQIDQEDERITVNNEDEVMQIVSSVRSVSDDAESHKANSRELVDKDDSVSMHPFFLLGQGNTSKEHEWEQEKEEKEHDEQQMQEHTTAKVASDTIQVYEQIVAVTLSSYCCSYHMPILEIEQKLHLIEKEEEIPQELQREYEEEIQEETLQEEQELLQDELIKYDWEDEMELQQDEERKLNSYLEAQMQFWKEDNEQQARHKAAPPQFVLDHAQHSKFITAAAVSALHTFAKHKGKESNEEFSDSDNDANDDDDDDDDDVEDSSTIDSNDDKDDEQIEDVDDIADKIFDTNGDVELENETNIVDDDMFISDLHGEFYDNVIENNNSKNRDRNESNNSSKNNFYSNNNNNRKNNLVEPNVNSSSDDSSSNNSSLNEERQFNEYEKRCNKTDPEEQNFWKELQSRIEQNVDNLDAGLRDNRHDCHTYERCSNDSNNFWDEECDDEFYSESSSKEDDKLGHCKLRRVENAEELSRWNVQRRRREERKARAPLIDSTTSSKSNFSKTNSLTDLGISDT